MGYSVEGKKTLNEAPEEKEEGGDEFDFAKETPAADEGGEEGTEGGEDFDFGGEEGTEGGDENADFDIPTEDEKAM